MGSWLNGVPRGASAGLTATAPTSAFTRAAERLGVPPGPPARAVVDRRIPDLREDVAVVAALGSPVASGGVAGAVFADGRDRTTRSGTAFGVLLRIAGYEGRVPALGLLPPAHRDRRPRAGVVLAAHVIHGAALGRLPARG